MINLIKEYFYFNRKERRGIFVLSILCLLGVLFPKIYQQIYPTKAQTNFSVFEKEIQEFGQKFDQKEVQEAAALFYFDPNDVSKEDLKSLGLSDRFIQTFLNFRSKGARFFKKEDLKKVYGLKGADYLRLEPFISIKKEKGTGRVKPEEQQKKMFKTELFKFDPNQTTKNDLLKLGFSERAANNLLKFREKGGSIRSKEELSKIYGVDNALFEKLYPYILIEELVPRNQEKRKSFPNEVAVKEEVAQVILDINTASAQEFQSLKGIGPYYSKKIVKFREALGGFYTVDQIGETYNFPDSTFQMIRSYLKYEAKPQQINLNTVSQEALAKHPYIKFNQAKVIINYREQHGPFKQIEELEKIKILTPELINKIKPYLLVP